MEKNNNYEVYQHRIDRINHLLSLIPKLEKRLDIIHKTLFNGGITSEEFVELTRERSVLIKQIDDSNKELQEKYRIVMGKDLSKTKIIYDNGE